MQIIDWIGIVDVNITLDKIEAPLMGVTKPTDYTDFN
jgi:hypothetical protein